MLRVFLFFQYRDNNIIQSLTDELNLIISDFAESGQGALAMSLWNVKESYDVFNDKHPFSLDFEYVGVVIALEVISQLVAYIRTIVIWYVQLITKEEGK